MKGTAIHRACVGAGLRAMALLILTTGGGNAGASIPGNAAAVDSTLGIFQVDSLAALSRPQQDALYSEYVLEVRRALEAQHFRAARDLAERASSLWPARQRPHLHRAHAEIGAQRWSPCILAARQARAAQADAVPPPPLPPEAPAAADYWEGLAFHQTQRYDEALPFLEKAAQAAPDWAEAHRALGETAFVMGHVEQAAAAYGRAFQLEGTVGGVRDLSYYADAMAQQGDDNLAIAALEAALERFPYEPGLHARLGTAFRERDELTEAYYHFTLEYLVQGSRGAFSQQARQEANAIYVQVEADADSPHRHELLLVSAGINDLRAGRHHQALHSLEHAVRVTHTNTVVPYLFLSDAQMHVHQVEEARRTLDDVLTLQPDFVPAMVRQARVLRALDDDEGAQALVERAFLLFPTYWRLQPENARQRG